MNIASNIKKKIILILVVFFSLNILILAEEQTYDPSKEPPFDKEQIVKVLKECIAKKKFAQANIYIADTFIKPERYQAATFAIKTLKTIPGFDKRYYPEVSLCLCYIFSGEKDEGMNCLRDYFMKVEYPNLELDKVSLEKKLQIEREYHLRIIRDYIVHYSSWFNEDKRESFILKMIEGFYKKYPKPTSEESEYLNKQQKMITDYQEMKKELSARRIARRKQILDYIQELEKLLVARDEQRLSEFLNKYVVPDMQKFFLERYIKLYFSKNYSEVHFKLIADSTGESIHLTGMNEEITDVEYIIKTIPESKGNECPETVYSGTEGDLYCQAGIRFKFITDKMYIF